MDRLGVTLIVLGVALALVSGFADTVGVGDDRGFHYRQGIGVGVGAAIAIAGIVIAVRRGRSGPPAQEAPPPRRPTVGPS
jgi:drug/metabolite transporter (DMT)-like permease